MLDVSNSGLVAHATAVHLGPAEGSAAEPGPRSCPVCGRSEGKLLFRQQFAAMSAGSLLAGYEVVICRGCGAGYADAIPPQAAFDEHYREMSKYEYQLRGGRESEYDLARFRATAEMIDQLAPSRSIRILDVGCATGGLLALLKERGYANVWGLDPSPVCAGAARRLYGVEVVTGSLGDLQFGQLGPQFDLVILSGVLEHIREVQWAIGLLAGLLADGGLMFVSVPDATRFAAEEDAPLQQFSTEHINFFSPVSLDNAMQAAGFVPLASRQNAYPQEHGTVMPVVDAMYQLRPGGKYRAKNNVGAIIAAGTRRVPDLRTRRVRATLFDRETEPALVEYIRRSWEVDESVHTAISAIVARGQPIIVWGVGTHTLRLLAASRLAEARIAAFVDSNPRYQGKQLHGRPIIAPDELPRPQRAHPHLVAGLPARHRAADPRVARAGNLNACS